MLILFLLPVTLDTEALGEFEAAEDQGKMMGEIRKAAKARIRIRSIHRGNVTTRVPFFPLDVNSKNLSPLQMY